MSYHSEEEQIQLIKNWWKENGTAIITGVVLSLVVIFGWRGWQQYQVNTNARSSDLYDQFLNVVDNDVEREAALGHLKEKFPTSSYAAYASLIQAKHMVDKADWNAAQTQLQWVLQHNDELKDIATLRLARIYIEQKSYDQAAQLLNQIPDNIYAAQYWEVKGDLAYHQGNLDQAKESYLKAKSAYSAEAVVPEILELKLNDLAQINTATTTEEQK